MGKSMDIDDTDVEQKEIELMSIKSINRTETVDFLKKMDDVIKLNVVYDDNKDKNIERDTQQNYGEVLQDLGVNLISSEEIKRNKSEVESDSEFDEQELEGDINEFIEKAK